MQTAASSPLRRNHALLYQLASLCCLCAALLLPAASAQAQAAAEFAAAEQAATAEQATPRQTEQADQPEEVIASAEATAEVTAETETAQAKASAHAPITEPTAAATPELPHKVYVVPIHGEINQTQLFILRRALKEALSNKAAAVVIDMDTPGGSVGVTLEMMEALEKFPGRTITFVDTEAMSAGSYISMATNDIWFSPAGIMGAAEAVSGGGQDINESMQRKLNSYLRAKVRSMATQSRYRADVQRAMMDPAFKLEIDGTVIKEPGELLSLTAEEAARTYGEPPEALLSSGTVQTVEELLSRTYGAGNYTVQQYELTWSESFARWFQTFTPLLLGAGILLLFIEFKTPGFGIMGGLGIALLLLVFASSYFAGLAGNEVLLLFILGVLLLGVEVLVLPGTLIAAALGSLFILASLLWAMADIWPSGAENYQFSPELFVMPLIKLAIGLAIAVVGAIVVAKIFPRTPLGRSMILSATVGGTDPVLAAGGSRSIRTRADVERQGTQAGSDELPAIGSRGIAVTPLRPSGIVEVNGQRYQAHLRLGQIERGEIIEVVDYRDFSLLVKADTGGQSGQ